MFCRRGKKSKRFREVAPVTRVSQWDADMLFIQYDADKLVQIYQAYRIMAKFKASEVESRLMVMPGKGHKWDTEPMEVKAVEEWFDKHHLETL